jgi:hypothetical protein
MDRFKPEILDLITLAYNFGMRSTGVKASEDFCD